MGQRDGLNRNAKRTRKFTLASLLAVAAPFVCILIQLTPLKAHAGPPAGTIIPNTANGTANSAGLPSSNTVQVITSVLSGATLVAPGSRTVPPGTTTYFPHTLTNGTAPETYALSATDVAGGFGFGSLVLYADANGDGNPDNTTPITTTGLLTANQAFRFVVAALVPAAAAGGQSDQIRVQATAPSLLGPLSNVDSVAVQQGGGVVDSCAAALTKELSRIDGPSPSAPITVTLRYTNPICPGIKTNFTIVDALPQNMTYVPGSGRWSSAGNLVLTDTSGDEQGASPNSIRYEYGAGGGRSVVAVLPAIASGATGAISFQVTVVGGLAVGTQVPNVAALSYLENGGPVGVLPPPPAIYTVTGSMGVRLVGQTLPTVTPGTTVNFENTLTNLSTVADTFNITLSDSNYPAGTTFQLFQPDGITPLVDTNGDGTPDTGVVAAGGVYKIIVKAVLPSTAVGGPFTINKTARSVSTSSVTATDVDRVTTLAQSCRIAMDPDHTGKVGVGRNIVYPHVITNMGNCDETVTFPGTFKSDSLTTWSSQAYLDDRGGSTASKLSKVAGIVDEADTLITNATSFVLKPGQSQRILVNVQASMQAAVGDANTTILRAVATSNPALMITDITTVDTKDEGERDNEIRNHTDDSRLVATIWAVIGHNLYLRANASACNANPDVIETRIVIITGPNGERETLTATETGPNTGIFMVNTIPVRRPPVIPASGKVEGVAGDVMDVEMVGCGRRIATTVTLIDPNGVVFDSKTNDPVAGAVVRLVTASNGVCSSTLATVSTLDMSTGQPGPSPNPVTTGADGRFDFPLVPAGQYCVQVSPPNGYTFSSAVPFTQLPPGRNIIATGPTSGGSYGGAFPVNAETGPVALDVPVDSGAMSGLFVQKTAQRTVVELGDTLDYTIKVKNQSTVALERANVLLTDSLPAGFTYVQGTARLEGKFIADPDGKGGPKLVFSVGHLNRDQEVTLTYRIRVGPGALQGDGTNRVFASYTVTDSALSAVSNTATAKVIVQGGVFTDKAYIVGKIYADCNKNGAQDEKEVGIPGVRLFMEDGTSVISDSEGKYSLYGITARTHILKLDRSTLPAGAKLLALGNRGMKGDNRFVDLKNGELHRADFALDGCDAKVMKDVEARRKAAAKITSEIEGRLQQKLETDVNAKPMGDLKSLPASGTIGATPGVGSTAIAPLDPSQPASTLAQPIFTPDSIAGAAAARARTEQRQRSQAASAAPVVELESLLPNADNTLAFLDLKSGQRLAYAQTNVRVKGMQGATFKLNVNGKDIGDDRVGKRTVVAERKLQAWEFVGVDLKGGENVLKLTQTDPFGNERGNVSVTVIAPDKLGKLIVELPKGGAVADGRTPARIVVKLTDDKGVPVTVRTPVSLETSQGVWQLEDVDSREPGLQTFIEGGTATFELLPPTQPGESLIRVSSGVIETEVKLDFMPDLRDLIAAGVVEGVLNLRKLNANALVPARAQDSFEQELQHLSRTSNDGKRDAAARAAFFLKGKIKGEYLLTMAYDSDKNTRDRLFRDIQPDEFYPVYGDSSIRGFDAQSTQKFYVRVDKQKSWLLYGDFNTAGYGDTQKLSNYSRSLTGAKGHYENGRVSANVFASRDSTRQIIEEIPANGTSGPYVLSSAKGLINSEKIEILTRDRSQPSLIVTTVPQARFVDYEIEPLTGRILFRAPVRSLDENLNPISIRVTYEIDQGGADFWVAGGDVQVKVTDKVSVGASYVKDKNPVDPFEMKGVNATVKLTDRTLLQGEIAQTDRPLAANGPAKGDAQRVDIKHRAEKFDIEAYAAQSDVGFENPGASISKGRSEAGVKTNIKLGDKTRAHVEALHTGDRATDGKRDGFQATIEHTLDNGIRVEGGVRYAKETTAAALPTYPNALNQGSTGTTPNEVTSVRAKVTGPLPGVKDASIYGELEVDVKDSDRKIAAVGGEYLLPNKGRLYARHEFISSLTGPYGLNSTQRQNSTVFGVDTEYMKDGKLFSEYRIRDALSGGDAEAAFGLRNLWTLGPGLKLGTGFERIHALSGKGDAESTALTFGLEYTASEFWKGTARLELREGTTSDSILSTLGFASKLNRDWTFLGRNTLSIVKNKGTASGENIQDRFQAGLAYRDTDTNVWSALGRVEHRTEKDTTQVGIELKRSVEILSVHANYQPRRPFTLTGRYAAKLANDTSNGLVTKTNAQLVAGRAIWEFAPRWDLGVQVSTLLGQGAQKRQYGLGLELGYMITENLWLAAGYNVFGFKDDDLVAGDYTNKGAYVRLRYKFDEELFDRMSTKSAPKTAQAGAAQ
jgi:uncharacterized repeat protein (TIGR01451 family)